MQKELVSKILKKVSKSTRKVYEGKFDEKLEVDVEDLLKTEGYQ